MNRFSIGADPEFSCFKNDEYLRAPQLYPNARINGGCSNSSTFGYDGNSATGEIRPAPTYNADDFVINIKKCLALGYLIIANHQNKNKEILKKVTVGESITDGSILKDIMAKIELRAGSFWCKPLGGHIHIGSKKFSKKFSKELEDSLLKPGQKERINDSYNHSAKNKEHWKYEYFIVNVLDSTIGIGLKLIENWERGRDRVIESSFGRFSNFNRQSWGIEYRTPPSWILSPDIARAVFELTQLSVYNITENTEATVQLLKESNLVDLALRDSEKAWQFIYKNCQKKQFRNQFRDNWLRVIEKLDKFNETKFLDPIMALVQDKQEWNDAVNLFESWEIDKDTFDSLEFVDPLNWCKINYRYDDDGESDEDLIRCPECDSLEIVLNSGDIECHGCGYDERNRFNEDLIEQYENGMLQCPNCESDNVSRQTGNCLQCEEEGCRHHVCDFFLR